MNTEGIHGDPKLPGINQATTEPTKLTEDLHKIIADGKPLVDLKSKADDETVVLYDEAHQIGTETPDTQSSEQDASLAEIRSAADLYEKAIITDFDNLTASAEVYERYQAEITQRVEDMLQQVNNRADHGDQLDRMASQVADDIATELIARDKTGPIVGRVSKEKQLLRAVDGLNKSAETGRLGIYERARLEIQEDFSILKQEENTEHMAGILEDGIRAKIRGVHRDAQTIHSDIDRILTVEAADIDGRLRQFRELRYYQDQTEHGSNKSDAVIALINGVDGILEAIEQIKQKTRQKALADEAMISQRYDQGTDLRKKILI